MTYVVSYFTAPVIAVSAKSSNVYHKPVCLIKYFSQPGVILTSQNSYCLDNLQSKTVFLVVFDTGLSTELVFSISTYSL